MIKFVKSRCLIMLIYLYNVYELRLEILIPVITLCLYHENIFSKINTHIKISIRYT